MATFTTNFIDFNDLFAVVNGEDSPDVTDLSPLVDLYDEFADNSRTPVEAGDQSTIHRTGVMDSMPGVFTVAGTSMGLGDNSWAVNGLIYNNGLDSTLILRSTAGITIDPIQTDEEFTGIINSAIVLFNDGTTEAMFGFTGTINVATGAVTANSIRFFSSENLGEDGFFVVEGTVTGSITGTFAMIS